MVVLLGFSSYSYSEIIHGNTNNAASSDINWVMTNVLPQVNGLTVGSVIYRYTVEKEVADPFTVSVYNLNTTSTGYTFRSTDDWSGLPGNTIAKIVPVADIPSASWGAGGISATGIGKISNPYVIYNYRYDTCTEPTLDINCPNYKSKVVVPVYQETTIETSVQPVLVEEEKKPTNEEVVRKKTVAKKKAIENSALLSAEAVAQAIAFQTVIKGFNTYSFTMDGGVYKESIKLIDAKLPDNRSGLINTWSQQSLHNQMIDSQYSLERK